MATQVEIINLALGHIAVAPIVTTTEATVAAKAVMRVWDTSRKECLRSHDWPFGTVVTTLTLNTTYATLTTSGLYAGEFIYAYDYPSNCVAMWVVYNENVVDKTKGDDFRVLYDPTNSQRVILTDAIDALCEYTFDVTDTSFFDASFVKMFSYKIAADVCLELTGNYELANNMLNEYKFLSSEAERSSALENNPNHIKEGTSSFIDARGGSDESLDYFDPNNTHPNG